jgi:thioredoxin-related protein
MYSHIIGNELQKGYDIIDTDAELDNTDIIGLYFSSKACKYCTEFTPILKTVYPFLKSSNIDIVFISSDRTENAFNENYALYPWYALPYKYRNLKQELVSYYDFKTIPQLIFINKNGEIIERDGRNFIVSCQKYPNFHEKIIQHLILNNKTVFTLDSGDF